jgi:hypothetical protein
MYELEPPFNSSRQTIVALVMVVAARFTPSNREPTVVWQADPFMLRPREILLEESSLLDRQVGIQMATAAVVVMGLERQVPLPILRRHLVLV